jgi:exopolyphosphatase/guanosine-5'-triphosphate,3'-diphosphate pyrophosphatase
VSRRAAIDVGTNSVRLLVADLPALDPSASHRPLRLGLPLRPVIRRLAITRLGDRLDEDGVIREPAAARTAAAVEEFAAEAAAAGVPSPVVFATYAMRVARNPATLLEKLNRPVRVLSGEDEARLGFLGAVAGLGQEYARARMLVVDIGGGSVELTRGTTSGIEEVHSVPLGCVVLTHRFLAHDPPQEREVSTLRAHVTETLGPMLDQLGPSVDAAIGVGGTITTMAALAQRLVPYDPDRVHGYRLALPQIAATLETLRARSLGERRALPGLQPERADVIIAGALVLHDVLRRLGGGPIVVSEADLLWAVLIEG